MEGESYNLWDLNEEARSRKIVCLTQGYSKACDSAGSRTLLTKNSRAEISTHIAKFQGL